MLTNPEIKRMYLGIDMVKTAGLRRRLLRGRNLRQSLATKHTSFQ